MSTRRGFLASILAAGFAPAAIGSGVLMPVKKIVRTDAWPDVHNLRFAPLLGKWDGVDDWTPARIFDGRTAGFWYDASQPNSVVLDSEGRIIGLRDLSGNGNPPLMMGRGSPVLAHRLKDRRPSSRGL